jgi:hypothetical protein
LAVLTSEKISEAFPEKPNLMPMLHVQHANGEEDAPTLQRMEELATRRVAAHLFSPGVIKELSLASGGHMRDFLFLVREAAGEAISEPRIEHEHATRAIAGLVDLYNRTIKQEFIEPLDYVAQHGELPGGPQDGELVNLLLVMEYLNDRSWSALHPCVRRAGRYMKAPRVNRDTPPTNS